MTTVFKRRAEECAQTILAAFEGGDLPKALAPVFINRKDNVPCRAWSWSNQLMTALSGTADARGFRQWQAVGRNVKKGSKAFPILVPLEKKRTEKDKKTGEEETRSYIYGFTSAPVFRFEDTEGDPLPPPDPAVMAWLEALPLRDVAEAWGLSVDAYNGEKAGYLGYYKHGEAIAVGVENLATWAHELVHAADDRNGTITKLPGQQPDNEIVAELGGAILLEILGHHVDSDRGGCWAYVKRYAKKNDLETIAVCTRLLNRTCDAVALILDTADERREPALVLA